MIGQKKHKRLTEEEAIDIILKHNTQTKENNLHSFIRGTNDYIFYAFDRMYDGFLSTKLITRQEFGFTDNKKPGDYDKRLNKNSIKTIDINIVAFQYFGRLA